jgi:hypothetical protein
MPRNPCGLKVGTRTAQIIVTLPRALAGNETATFKVHLADLDGGGDPLFLLAALTITAQSVPLPNTFQFPMLVQDFSKGPVIGYGEGGIARLKLFFESASANFNVAVTAHLEVIMLNQKPFLNPEQPIALAQMLEWYVTS